MLHIDYALAKNQPKEQGSGAKQPDKRRLIYLAAKSCIRLGFRVVEGGDLRPKVVCHCYLGRRRCIGWYS